MDVWRGLQAEPEHDYEADHRAHVDAWIDQIKGRFHAGHQYIEEAGRQHRIVPGVIVKQRGGKLVFRLEGRRGDDSLVLPLEAENLRREAAFLAELAEVLRELRLPEVRAARSKQAAVQKARTVVAVLALASLPEMRGKGRNMAGAIAKRLTITPRRVRQILAEQKSGND